MSYDTQTSGISVRHAKAKLFQWVNAPSGEMLRSSRKHPEQLWEQRHGGTARSVLTGYALLIPIGGDRLLLGTWQGVFLWKHRTAGHTRSIFVTLVGD